MKLLHNFIETNINSVRAIHIKSPHQTPQNIPRNHKKRLPRNTTWSSFKTQTTELQSGTRPRSTKLTKAPPQYLLEPRTDKHQSKSLPKTHITQQKKLPPVTHEKMTNVKYKQYKKFLLLWLYPTPSGNTQLQAEEKASFSTS